MLKIKDKTGHTIAVLKDGDSEPELTEEEKRRQALKELTQMGEEMGDYFGDGTENNKENEQCDGTNLTEANKKPLGTN